MFSNRPKLVEVWTSQLCLEDVLIFSLHAMPAIYMNANSKSTHLLFVYIIIVYISKVLQVCCSE